MKSTIVCLSILIVCLSALLSCSFALFFIGERLAGLSGLIASLVSLFLINDLSKELT